MATVSQSVFTVNFGSDSYATIDKVQGVVTIHEGQRLGLDSDWGGRIVAALTLEQAEAIANALYVPWSRPDFVYMSAEPAEQRDDYIGS